MPENYKEHSYEQIKDALNKEKTAEEYYEKGINVLNKYISEVKSKENLFWKDATKPFEELKIKLDSTWERTKEYKRGWTDAVDKENINLVAKHINEADKKVLKYLQGRHEAEDRKKAEQSREQMESENKNVLNNMNYTEQKNQKGQVETVKKDILVQTNEGGVNKLIFTNVSNKIAAEKVLGNLFKQDASICYAIDYSKCTNPNIQEKIPEGTKYLVCKEGKYYLANEKMQTIGIKPIIREGVSLVNVGKIKRNENSNEIGTLNKHAFNEIQEQQQRSQEQEKQKIAREQAIFREVSEMEKLLDCSELTDADKKELYLVTEKRVKKILTDMKKEGFFLQSDSTSRIRLGNTEDLLELHFINEKGETKNISVREKSADVSDVNDGYLKKDLYNFIDGKFGFYDSKEEKYAEWIKKIIDREEKQQIGENIQTTQQAKNIEKTNEKVGINNIFGKLKDLSSLIMKLCKEDDRAGILKNLFINFKEQVNKTLTVENFQGFIRDFSEKFSSLFSIDASKVQQCLKIIFWGNKRGEAGKQYIRAFKELGGEVYTEEQEEDMKNNADLSFFVHNMPSIEGIGFEEKKKILELTKLRVEHIIQKAINEGYVLHVEPVTKVMGDVMQIKFISSDSEKEVSIWEDETTKINDKAKSPEIGTKFYDYLDGHETEYLNFLLKKDENGKSFTEKIYDNLNKEDLGNNAFVKDIESTIQKNEKSEGNQETGKNKEASETLDSQFVSVKNIANGTQLLLKLINNLRETTGDSYLSNKDQILVGMKKTLEGLNHAVLDDKGNVKEGKMKKSDFNQNFLKHFTKDWNEIDMLKIKDTELLNLVIPGLGVFVTSLNEDNRKEQNQALLEQIFFEDKGNQILATRELGKGEFFDHTETSYLADEITDSAKELDLKVEDQKINQYIDKIKNFLPLKEGETIAPEKEQILNQFMHCQSPYELKKILEKQGFIPFESTYMYDKDQLSAMNQSINNLFQEFSKYDRNIKRYTDSFMSTLEGQNSEILQTFSADEMQEFTNTLKAEFNDQFKLDFYENFSNNTLGKLFPGFVELGGGASGKIGELYNDITGYGAFDLSDQNMKIVGEIIVELVIDTAVTVATAGTGAAVFTGLMARLGNLGIKAAKFGEKLTKIVTKIKKTPFGQKLQSLTTINKDGKRVFDSMKIAEKAGSKRWAKATVEAAGNIVENGMSTYTYNIVKSISEGKNFLNVNAGNDPFSKEALFGQTLGAVFGNVPLVSLLKRNSKIYENYYNFSTLGETFWESLGSYDNKVSNAIKKLDLATKSKDMRDNIIAWVGGSGFREQTTDEEKVMYIESALKSAILERLLRHKTSYSKAEKFNDIKDAKKAHALSDKLNTSINETNLPQHLPDKLDINMASGNFNVTVGTETYTISHKEIGETLKIFG